MSNNTIKAAPRTSFLGGITNGLTRIFERYLPDPLVIVILLTLVIMVSCMVLKGDSPSNVLGYWMSGFWNLHEFAMQMVLILMGGFVVATTPLFKRLIIMISKSARTPGRAIVMVTLVSLLASWINWGIGLVAGAVLAKELTRRVPNVDYRLLISSAYSGFLIWHAGLSGSIPLSLATPGHFLEDTLGLIPTSQTLFSPLNLGLVVAMFIALPLTNYFLMKNSDVIPLTHHEEEVGPVQVDRSRPSEYLEHAMWPALLISVVGISAVAFYAINGGGLNLNVIIFALIFVGIGLHKNLNNFLTQVNEAVKGASGVIIQFPFYAGLMGIMAQSGLASDLAQVFVNISTSATLPLWSFLSAGLINMLIPSGGGQWAVQGPIVMEAAQALHADISRVAIAFAWGDSWTNMLQPFWALPALAIAGLKARDIMGYCAVVLVVSGVIIGLTLLVFG